MILEIQKYLRTPGNTVESLCEQYKLKTARHKVFPNLVQFKYWIDSPMAETICREARGLILDENEDWKVICFTFKKFFNFEEGHADKLTSGDISCYDKVDGGLIQMYHYAGDWHVATTGLPDASGGYSKDTPDKTVADLFWKTWSELNYKYPEEKDVCFAFELVTEYNRIICKYDKPRIVLLGGRDLLTLEEYLPEKISKKYNWEVVKRYPMNTLEDIVSAAKEINPMEREGFVLVGGFASDDLCTHLRVKVKNPAYVALHHLKDGMSNKRLLQILQNNESEEFLSYFPEFTEQYQGLKKKFLKIVKEAEDMYMQYSDCETAKEFALHVAKLPYSGILFGLRNGKISSIKEGFREIRVEHIMNWLGVQKED